MTTTYVSGAGESKEFKRVGKFFRLLNCTNSVDISFYRNGRKELETNGILSGYAETFDNSFDSIVITSATSQTIQFIDRSDSDVRYDRLSGSVNISSINNVRPFLQNNITVTNSSSVISSAKFRTYLLIQNNSLTGTLAINLVGNTADFSSGIEIKPGGYFELQGPFPTTAITAVSDIASNPDVVLVEGSF